MFQCGQKPTVILSAGMILAACNLNNEVYLTTKSQRYISDFVGEYSVSEVCANITSGDNTISIQVDEIRFGIQNCRINTITELTAEFDMRIDFSESVIMDVVEADHVALLKRVSADKVIVKQNNEKAYPIFRCSA